jgi:hypothetical protein
MFLLKDYLESQNMTVRIIKEPIRDILDYLNTTIDDLRSNFNTFLQVQKEVILNRKTFEIEMSVNLALPQDLLRIRQSYSLNFTINGVFCGGMVNRTPQPSL